MPVKIKYTTPLSNKTQTLPVKQNLKGGLPLNPVFAPVPFIDKISLVLEPENETDAKDIYAAVAMYQHDSTLVVDAGSKAKWGDFKWAKRIKLDCLADPKRYPLLQLATHNKLATKFRLEFVPVDLGEKGVEELNAALTQFMPDGWAYFLKRGRITRLDVAVDFPEVLVDQFQFLASQGATTKQWRVDGKLESYRHGKPRANHTLIYDRKAKRIAQKKSWKGKEGMRIERRLKPPPITKLLELPSLPNPFLGMKLIGMPAAPPSESKKSPYVWDFFLKVVEVEGLMSALARLPEERRTLYRKHLAVHKVSWWDPEAIWKNWPAAYWPMLAHSDWLLYLTKS